MRSQANGMMLNILTTVRSAAKCGLLVVMSLVALPALVSAQSETVEYYGLDALGSVRVIFDAQGGVVDRMDYGPFGENLRASINFPTEQFAQLSRDVESGKDCAQPAKKDEPPADDKTKDECRVDGQVAVVAGANVSLAAMGYGGELDLGGVLHETVALCPSTAKGSNSGGLAQGYPHKSAWFDRLPTSKEKLCTECGTVAELPQASISPILLRGLLRGHPGWMRRITLSAFQSARLSRGGNSGIHDDDSGATSCSSSRMSVMRKLPPLKKYWLLQLLLVMQIFPLALLLLLPPPFFGYGVLLATANAVYVALFVLGRIRCGHCGYPITRSFRMFGHPGRQCKQCGADLWTDARPQNGA